MVGTRLGLVLAVTNDLRPIRLPRWDEVKMREKLARLRQL